MSEKKTLTSMLGTTFIVFIGLVIVITILAVIGDLTGAGEQNIPGWILIAIIYNPVILLGSILAIYGFVYVYFYLKRYENEPRKPWPDIGSKQYEKELKKASLHIVKPERVDIYANNKNMSIMEVEELLGKGELKGYVLSGRTFIENA